MGRIPVPKDIPASYRAAYRALLRETSYLPDHTARVFYHEYIRRRFRKSALTLHGPTIREFQDRTKTHKAKPDVWLDCYRFERARKMLAKLWRANNGHFKTLHSVLRHAYGRIGRRHHMLLDPLTRPDFPSTDMSLRDRVAARAHPAHHRHPTVSPAIKALFHAQSLAADAKKCTKPSNPDIPTYSRGNPGRPLEDKFGQPLGRGRLAHIARERLRECYRSLFPPLPRSEWEDLRERALGIKPFKGAPRRRGQVQNLQNFPVAQAHPVNGRLLRRAWARIYLETPCMWREPGHPGQPGPWRVEWGDLTDKQREALQGGFDIYPPGVKLRNGNSDSAPDAAPGSASDQGQGGLPDAADSQKVLDDTADPNQNDLDSELESASPREDDFGLEEPTSPREDDFGLEESTSLKEDDFGLEEPTSPKEDDFGLEESTSPREVDISLEEPRPTKAKSGETTDGFKLRFSSPWKSAPPSVGPTTAMSETPTESLETLPPDPAVVKRHTRSANVDAADYGAERWQEPERLAMDWARLVLYRNVNDDTGNGDGTDEKPVPENWTPVPEPKNRKQKHKDKAATPGLHRDPNPTQTPLVRTYASMGIYASTSTPFKPRPQETPSSSALGMRVLSRRWRDSRAESEGSAGESEVRSPGSLGPISNFHPNRRLRLSFRPAARAGQSTNQG